MQNFEHTPPGKPRTPEEVRRLREALIDLMLPKKEDDPEEKD